MAFDLRPASKPERNAIVTTIVTNIVKNAQTCYDIMRNLVLVASGYEMAMLGGVRLQQDPAEEWNEILRLIPERCTWPEDFDWWDPAYDVVKQGGYHLIWNTKEEVLCHYTGALELGPSVDRPPGKRLLHSTVIIPWSTVMQWRPAEDAPMFSQVMTRQGDQFRVKQLITGDEYTIPVPKPKQPKRRR